MLSKKRFGILIESYTGLEVPNIVQFNESGGQLIRTAIALKKADLSS